MNSEYRQVLWLLYFEGLSASEAAVIIDGRYYSEFVYNGVGFCIDAEGVTEEEFVAMIKSVIA